MYLYWPFSCLLEKKNLLLPTAVFLAEDRHIIKLCYAVPEDLSTKIINFLACEALATCILRNQPELILETELCIAIWTCVFMKITNFFFPLQLVRFVLESMPCTFSNRTVPLVRKKAVNVPIAQPSFEAS